MSKKGRGILLIVLGLVLVMAGAGLHILHEQQDALAGRNSAQLLEALSFELQLNDSFGGSQAAAEPTEPAETSEPEKVAPNKPPIVTADPVPPEETVEAEDPMETDAMPVRTLAGYDLIGIIRVPSVKIELPVLHDWSYSLLNIAPCRYSGSLEQGNLILLGHSYKSQLEPIEKAKPGDSVELVDMNGRSHRFTIDSVDIIPGTAVDQLASEHPLIIFTCTRDSAHRIVVRCHRVEN